MTDDQPQARSRPSAASGPGAVQLAATQADRQLEALATLSRSSPALAGAGSHRQDLASMALAGAELRSRLNDRPESGADLADARQRCVQRFEALVSTMARLQRGGPLLAPADPQPARVVVPEPAGPASTWTGADASQDAPHAGVPSAPATPPTPVPVAAPGSGPLQHVDDLLALHGTDFVHQTYRHLLGREPDPEGLAYFTQRVQARHDQAAIVYEFATSSEARDRPLTMPGLADLVAQRSPRQGRLRRWLQRAARAMATTSRLEPAISRLRAESAAQAADHTAAVAALNAPLSNVSAELAEVKATLAALIDLVQRQQAQWAAAGSAQTERHDALRAHIDERFAAHERRLPELAPLKLALAQNSATLTSQAELLQRHDERLTGLQDQLAAVAQHVAAGAAEQASWHQRLAAEISQLNAPPAVPPAAVPAEVPTPLPLPSALDMTLSVASGPAAFFDALASGLAHSAEAHRLAQRTGG